MRSSKFLILVLFTGTLLFLALPSLGQAASAAGTGSGGYLSGYETADPRPTQASWWSTLAYVISLLLVFAFVLVLAYFASRFLSGRFAAITPQSEGRILEHLPLGPNRSVCVVELASRIFVLGVTEQSITLLKEIVDVNEIERLHSKPMEKASLGTDHLFSQQLNSLEQIARRVPSLFKDGKYHK
ncbi:MAG: flagellar biosynthetic protein FliO [Selenomonadaceae bacterium]